MKPMKYLKLDGAKLKKENSPEVKNTKPSFYFPIFLKIVMVSLFFSLLSLSLYIATFYSPRSFIFEYLVYIGIILLGTSLFAAGSIVEPIERLKEGFNRITRGEYVFVEINSGDELEELADSFNKMAYELNRQREVIERSEEKYRALIEDINDWVFEINENMIVTYSSSRSIDMIGKRPEEINGKSFFDLVNPGDLSIIKEKFENLESGKLFSGIDIHLAGEKREIFVEVSGRPYFDETGRLKGYRCVARDISLRKKAEEEAAYLISILEHTIDAIVSLDLDTNIVSWNKGAELMFGYTAEEMIGKPLQVLLPKDRHRACAENFKRAIQEGYARDIETVRISKDGRMIIVDQTLTAIHDSKGEIVGFVAIMRDITQRKKSEEELRLAYNELEEKTKELLESKKELEYLANIVENSNDAIFSIDLDGRITSWNKTAETLFGWKKDEIIGRGIEVLVPEEIRTEIENIRERMRKGAFHISYETRRFNKDGEIIDVEVTVTPVYDHDGKLSRISFISRDISIRMKTEKELLRKISRYDIDKGKVYLVEHSPEICDEVVADLIKCGFNGTIFSRRSKEDINCSDAEIYYISEKQSKDVVSSDLKKLKEIILNLPGWNNAVLIDLDYLIIKNGFSKVLEFIQELRDAFYLFRKGVIVLNIDPSLVSDSEFKVLRKECETIRSKSVDLPSEIYELARYIYMENRVGNKPSIKDVMERFNIARNTAKKRINYLVGRGLLKIEKDGRIKLLELTDYGKDYFLMAQRAKV
jgi:PAS domain S-box-containing protein